MTTSHKRLLKCKVQLNQRGNSVSQLHSSHVTDAGSTCGSCPQYRQTTFPHGRQFCGMDSTGLKSKDVNSSHQGHPTSLTYTGCGELGFQDMRGREVCCLVWLSSPKPQISSDVQTMILVLFSFPVETGQSTGVCTNFGLLLNLSPTSHIVCEIFKQSILDHKGDYTLI